MAPKKAFPPVPKNCCVTGGSGFVGQRLVEMLVERGARLPRCLAARLCSCEDVAIVTRVSRQAPRVVSFDISPKPTLWGASDDPAIVYMQARRMSPRREQFINNR